MNIELIQGDCLEKMKDIPDGSIDVIICDLPFYKVVKEDWDNQWKTEEEYIAWSEEIIIQYKRLLKENGNIFLFTGRQYNRKISTILDKHFIEQRIISWSRKRNFNNTRGRALASGYEPICFYSNGLNSTFNTIKIQSQSKRKEYTDGHLKDGITLSDVWDDIPALPHNAIEKVNHPTQKPIELIKRCIQIGTNEGDIILDNTMGSGTTGVACLETNRRFIGIEKDETYFEIAKKRIEERKKEMVNQSNTNKIALWE